MVGFYYDNLMAFLYCFPHDTYMRKQNLNIGSAPEATADVDESVSTRN